MRIGLSDLGGEGAAIDFERGIPIPVMHHEIGADGSVFTHIGRHLSPD
jgi:hypothetical protein